MKLLDAIHYPGDLKKIDRSALNKVCIELRERIIEVVSKNGGHLGASLGVVELTVALHYVYNTPKDLIIWDVGHQAYAHKIITGRNDSINTIRQSNGISGFTKRSESIYDPFGAGHSSTSISAALGMAAARDIMQENHKVIAIIGDGAISAGMAYEALNNAGVLNTDVLIILNDNKMSISPAVGSMSNYLAKLLSWKKYYQAKNIAKNFLYHVPNFINQFCKKIKKCAKQWATNGNFFEEMGLHYIGPVDGHDLDNLITILQNIKNNDAVGKPILLHLITEKGRGFNSPEKSLESYHAISPFDINTKIQLKQQKKYLTYTDVFANSLLEFAKKDKKVVAITAAMASGTGLWLLQQHVPKQVYDVGIAEQHAVTFAAGLAAANMKPFVVIYSTFLQRGYDQIVHDVAIQSLPVKFMIDRAGFVGQDGATHAGSFDISYLINLPNFICMAPSSASELMHMIATAYYIDNAPCAIRYPKMNTEVDTFHAEVEPLEIGKGRIIQEGKEIAVLSLGARLNEIIKADILLQEDGFKITIADARFAKPIDEDLIKHLAQNHKILITIEEGAIGGFGSVVMHYLSRNDLLNANLKFHMLCFPDLFLEHHSTIESMYSAVSLDSVGIYRQIKALIFNDTTIL